MIGGPIYWLYGSKGSDTVVVTPPVVDTGNKCLTELEKACVKAVSIYDDIGSIFDTSCFATPIKIYYNPVKKTCSNCLNGLGSTTELSITSNGNFSAPVSRNNPGKGACTCYYEDVYSGRS